jgi:glycosyltransferase involved in cell wall biosynthesis
LTLDANRAGIPDEQLVLVKVQFSAMPAYLRLMDFGLFFIKPCFSKKGSSATKLGEFLATGIPVVINNGVGDSGRIVQEHGVGVVLPETGARDIAASVVKIKELLSDPLVRIRCRETAEQYFDLQRGVEMYGALYAQLGGALASNHT